MRITLIMFLCIMGITKEKPMTYKGQPFCNDYEKRIWEAKQRIKEDSTPYIQHEIYPYIGTSNKQRRYLVKHNIKHFRKDGEYK